MKFINIIWMVLVAAILTELSQSDSTNITEQEAGILLELHAEFCGEDFMCKNDSSYWEPAANLIPTPCCVPCSCSPECGNQLNCCPTLRNNDAVEDQQPDKNVTMPIGQTSNQNDINDDVIAREGVARDRTMGDLGSSESMPMTNCVRPQALYKLNRNLNSEAYEMVTTCPVWFEDEETIEKCHTGMENDNLINIIPIQSKLTGLTYANKYCLDCNRAYENDTSEFREWQPILVGFSASFLHKSFIRPEFIKKDILSIRSGFENIHFEPNKASTAPVKCKAYDVTFCNQTGFLDVYNDTIANICHNGPVLPIMHDVRPPGISYRSISDRKLFKNIACLLCNTDQHPNGLLNSCGYYKDPQPKWKYRLSFNLESLANIGMESTRNPLGYLGDSSLILLKQGQCKPGHAELQVITAILTKCHEYQQYTISIRVKIWK